MGFMAFMMVVSPVTIDILEFAYVLRSSRVAYAFHCAQAAHHLLAGHA
jgi:hypothetical protein